MIYLQHITQGFLIASTSYPKNNKEDYRELTKEEYEELIAAIQAEEEAAAEEEAN